MVEAVKTAMKTAGKATMETKNSAVAAEAVMAAETWMEWNGEQHGAGEQADRLTFPRGQDSIADI